MGQECRVATAGAYVVLPGSRVPFMVGPTRAGDALGVVRLGGHREPGETSLACAAREVWEEASLRIEPVRPPATYQVEVGAGEFSLGDWPRRLLAGPVPPVLVSRRQGDALGRLSVMYLARSEDEPVPAAETRGLLLLDGAWVARLAAGGVTLREYLGQGGRAVLREELPPDLPLVGLGQLQWLAWLLERHPDLLERA
jgi:8-oxo-dGTP pyrophosphatase MutT (NUDIX family)